MSLFIYLHNHRWLEDPQTVDYKKITVYRSKGVSSPQNVIPSTHAKQLQKKKKKREIQ